jgi:penicillin-binding protein 1A
MTLFAARAKQLRTIRNSLLVLGALLVVLFSIIGYQTWHIYQSELPSFEQLHNIEPSLNTKVYDRNGALLKEFYSENRVLTPFKEIPPHMVNMLLASEDQEFYSHWGINLRRVIIVAAGNVLQWEAAAGASTITQQLSRMLFLNRERTIERKVKEALTAVKLERTYSKSEIIEMYLNMYYFGRGAYGIASAAHVFFSKKPSELSINDCAILVGQLKGPNINSPFIDKDKSLQARNRVLYSFYSVGKITEHEFDSLKAMPLEVHPPSENSGIAPYFTESIRQYILDRYGESELYTGGLKVFSSLDANLQAVAEKALDRKIDSLRGRIESKYGLDNKAYTKASGDTTDSGDEVRDYKKIQGAFLAIDNETGDILAMIGGRSFSETKFNRSTQALRQPGSAFKPFIYTACIDNGYKPSEIIDDNPIVLDIPGAKQWRPHNYDNEFLGPITMRDALKWSRNLVAIRLILKIGPEQAIFYARRLGITTPLTAVPSLAIGVSEVKQIELVSAFTTFPNMGIHTPPRYIYKIVDRYGRVLEDNSSIVREEVLSEQTAFMVTDMMRSTVDQGTAARIRSMGFSRPAGGKTGTSDSFTDNWFIGFTPQITAGVWVGFDDKTSLGQTQDGARNCVPVWTEFMLAAHDSLPIRDFDQPEGLVRQWICRESGELATDRCDSVFYEIFREDNQPEESCHIHQSRRPYRPDASHSGDGDAAREERRSRF